MIKTFALTSGVDVGVQPGVPLVVVVHEEGKRSSFTDEENDAAGRR